MNTTDNHAFLQELSANVDNLGYNLAKGNSIKQQFIC